MNDLINKFPNGQELYNNNATFNYLVNSIYRGASLYEAISVLVEINISQQKMMEEMYMKMPVSPIIFKEE